MSIAVARVVNRNLITGCLQCWERADKLSEEQNSGRVSDGVGERDDWGSWKMGQRQEGIDSLSDIGDEELGTKGR